MAPKIINLQNPFECKAVYFTDDREPIRDCKVFITDRFLILCTTKNEETPEEAQGAFDWINLDYVKGLEGVKVIRPTQPRGLYIK